MKYSRYHGEEESSQQIVGLDLVAFQPLTVSYFFFVTLHSYSKANGEN